jgi:hypothetical protein
MGCGGVEPLDHALKFNVNCFTDSLKEHNPIKTKNPATA